MSNDRFFSRQEVERILKRAIEYSTNFGERISESELMQIASELNIDPKYIKLAISQDQELIEFEQAKTKWRRKKKREFFEHLTAFAIVNLFLVGLNLFIADKFAWSLIVILGWGIGLAFDFIESFFPSEDKIERGARKLMNSKKWRNLLDRIIQKVID